ncbi:PREDICTED: chorion peroxidase [Papilio polytes]|uniref:chorion peroxidase n=1 Tax=Papilio polytes TaxID=76194 RepID=UPI000676838A|nr:PREDICTED: chorion peroxidase [Papilio polytes]
MFTLKSVIYIFVYITVVCPLIKVQCHERIDIKKQSYDENEHVHGTPPCEICPRKGICVPKVQCPAHVRPNSNHLLCHLEHSRSIGVCCFTGQQHAAESDHKMRSSKMGIEDMKSAHKLSHQKVAEWLRTAENLLKDNTTIVDISAPSYGHFLSTVTYDERAKELGRGGLLNMFAARELKSRQAISDDELALGFTDHTDGPYCPPLPNCPPTESRYRTLGGQCNNVKYPSWGATNTAFERLLPPDYSDGIWALRKSLSGLPLPSARTVSHRLLVDANNPSRTHNLMFMQFGQFIAHDISAGVVYTAGDNKPISCCIGDGKAPLPPHLRHWACAPIEVEPNDPFFEHFGVRCINFVRAQLSPAADCSVGYAKQMNGATQYQDLSHIYGSTKEKTDSLRAPGGLLKVFKDYGRDLPPATDKKDCLNSKGGVCFDSGDNHANQILSLTVLHTIWTREHNRVARILARLNPKWTNDTVFMETRRILQAEFQHIIYNEWLPLLLGPQIMREFQLLTFPGYSSGYDPQVNPSLTVEFSAAAMRFGHSVVDGKIMVPGPKSGEIYETISIPEIMLQPSRLRLLPFLDRVLIGLLMQPMQSVDPFITEGLSRYMFRGVKPYGLDLAAINIQRGRDVGLRSYNHYRRLCGLKPFTDFKQYSIITAQRLSSVYQSPEDVDLWIGGLLEASVEGGVVGPTFANIIADQFIRIKKGDRYFYDYGPDVNPGAFTPSQLAEIKKVTFSSLLCDNRDGAEFTLQSPNAFLRPDLPGNEPVSCDSQLIPKIDLNKFREI